MASPCVNTCTKLRAHLNIELKQFGLRQKSKSRSVEKCLTSFSPFDFLLSHFTCSRMKNQGVTSDASAIVDMSFEITCGSTFSMMIMAIMTYATTTGSANDATTG